ERGLQPMLPSVLSRRCYDGILLFSATARTRALLSIGAIGRAVGGKIAGRGSRKATPNSRGAKAGLGTGARSRGGSRLSAPSSEVGRGEGRCCKSAGRFGEDAGGGARLSMFRWQPSRLLPKRGWRQNLVALRN